MKKRLTLLLLALVCMLVLSACGCKHETWKDATCETPKTCAECGETEGAPLGHSWMAATCKTAKTCEICGKTDGEALGHKWADATCEAPKTCQSCSLTEGEALGHVWVDATTEAPKTCQSCAATEGEKITTDPRFTTAATADVQGKWVYSVDVGAEEMDLEGFTGTLKCQIILELMNEGTANLSVEFDNLEAFFGDLTVYMTELLYAEMEAAGLSKEEADAGMVEAYGLTVEEYAAYVVESISVEDLLGELSMSGVYYVADGKLFIGESWDEDLEGTPFSLDGDKLILEEDLMEMGEENTVFLRMAE